MGSIVPPEILQLLRSQRCLDNQLEKYQHQIEILADRQRALMAVIDKITAEAATSSARLSTLLAATEFERQETMAALDSGDVALMMALRDRLAAGAKADALESDE